jgi:hypothetical protein
MTLIVMSFEDVVPPALAMTVIVAAPAATPVTTPVPLTVALSVFADDHVNEAVMLGVAVTCTVPPMTILLDGALMLMLINGTARTAIDCCPCFPPADAITAVWPGATPLTTPSGVMLATDGEPVDQVTVPTPMDVPF